MKLTRMPTMIVSCVAALGFFQDPLAASIVTETRNNTDHIVVPTFDSSLGTLTRVDLTVTLRNGQTFNEQSHSYKPIILQSTNSRSDSQVGPFSPFNLVTQSAESYRHTFITPTYSDGGLNLGNFVFQTEYVAPHSHRVTVVDNGLQQVGENDWRASVRLQFDSHLTSPVSYASQEKQFTYTSASLEPFYGTSDLIIFDNAFRSNLQEGHAHTLPDFNITVPSETSDWAWNFPTITTPKSGSQVVFANPRFDTVATFHYVAAVPEPLSFVVWGGLTCFAALVIKRRERVQAS